MSANPDTATPTGRNKPAQGNALGHTPQNTSSPEGAKEGGELPAGWRCQSLGRQCNILAGFGFPERYQGKSNGELPFYKVGDISETWKRGDTFLTRANHYVSYADARELRAKPLPANTTVFAKIGAAIALNRRAILSEPALVDNNVMGLHPCSEDLDFKFLFHFVCTLKLDELSRATTVPSIRKSDIEAIAIPVPPLPEQRRIVAEIEKQLTRLEAGVAALRRVQANLKRYRAAVLKAACEGRLVPTEAALAGSPSSTKKGPPAYETGEDLLARILAERRENWQGPGRYKEPAAPDTENLAQIPDGWMWSALGQLATHITDGTHKTPTYVDSGVPFLSAKDISGFRLSFDKCRYIPQSEHEEMSKRCDVRRGNVLITKSGTIGRVAVVETDDEFSLFESVANVPVLPPIEAKFISLAAFVGIAGAFGAANKKGVAVRHLHLEDLRRVPIPLPPLAEQTRIVAEVERRLSVVEELESVVTANLLRARSLRQSILGKAFKRRLA